MVQFFNAGRALRAYAAMAAMRRRLVRAHEKPAPPPPAGASAESVAAGRSIAHFRPGMSSLQIALASAALGARRDPGGRPCSVRSVQPFECRTAVLSGGVEAAEGSAAIVSVEPDRVLRCKNVGQSLPWGMTRIRAPAARKPRRLRNRSLPGVNADVFLLDTGVQRRHPDLNVVEARSFVSWEPSPWDENGHGTAVAGVIGARDNRTHVVGVAPGVRIRSLKVLDGRGEGTLSDIVAAVEHMIRWKRAQNRRVRNAVVANLSLGGFVGGPEYTALDLALRRAVQAGITVVVAAGNEGDDALLYTPAHCREAICVGATDRGDVLTPWSNWGAVVHLHAPGDGVLTTALASYVQSISGTSFAAPHVAGAAALWLARRRTQSPGSVRWNIVRRAPFRVNVRSRPATTRRRLDVGGF